VASSQNACGPTAAAAAATICGHVANSRLTDRSVAKIVKQCAMQAGFDASTVSPHGLRAEVSFGNLMRFT
jgi:site-specific recombinase XerD